MCSFCCCRVQIDSLMFPRLSFWFFQVYPFDFAETEENNSINSVGEFVWTKIWLRRDTVLTIVQIVHIVQTHIWQEGISPTWPLLCESFWGWLCHKTNPSSSMLLLMTHTGNYQPHTPYQNTVGQSIHTRKIKVQPLSQLLRHEHNIIVIRLREGVL